MGLDYHSTVMLTCKLLFAAAKAIVDIGPDMPHYVYWTSFSSGKGFIQYSPFKQVLSGVVSKEEVL